MIYRTSLLSLLGNIQTNEDHLHNLVQQLKAAGVTPYIGAGLSIPFGMRGWGSFLMNQSEQAGIKAKIKRRLKLGQYEEAAQDLKDSMDPFAFNQAIYNEYRPDRLAGKDFQGAVALLSQLASNLVITTNFDHVAEEGFKEAKLPFEYIVWGAHADIAIHAVNCGKRVLLKIHGDVMDAHNRILTENEYIYHYENPDNEIDFSKPLPSLIRAMLIQRPLLFIGSSLNTDRPLKVLKVTADFQAMKHYAIVEHPKTIKERHVRAIFLSARNINPIWYPCGQHDLVEVILQYLLEQKTDWDKKVDVLQNAIIILRGDLEAAWATVDETARGLLLDEVREPCRIAATSMLDVEDDLPTFGRQMCKYLYSAMGWTCHSMAIYKETERSKRLYASRQAILCCVKTLKLLEIVEQTHLARKEPGKILHAWIINDEFVDRTLFYTSLSLAINRHSGGKATSEMVVGVYNLLSPNYRLKYPFSDSYFLKLCFDEHTLPNRLTESNGIIEKIQKVLEQIETSVVTQDES